MRQRSPRKEKFIELYLESHDATKAALEAGYSAHTAMVKGSQLKREFADEINRRIADDFKQYAPSAARKLHELMDKSENDMVKYRAASDILDRAGHKPAERVEQITPKADTSELMADLKKDFRNVLPKVWELLTPDVQEECLEAIGAIPKPGYRADVVHLRAVETVKPQQG